MTEKRRMPDEALITIAIILSRILIYVIGYCAVRVNDPHTTFTFETFLSSWGGGDTEHYARIAEFGYQPGTEYANLIVFLPLYPLAIRLFAIIIPNYFIAGMVANNIFSICAGIMLYRLARLDMERGAAMRTVRFMFLYPFALFLASVYTEGLFLLLAILTAYFARKGRFILSGIAGMLCAFTRVQGVVIAALVFVEILERLRPFSGGFKSVIKRIPKSAWGVLLIPLGVAAYLVLNKVLYGSFTQFMVFQADAPWYQGMGFFGSNLAQHFFMALEHPSLAYILYIPQLLLFFIICGLILAGIRRNIRPSYLVFTLAFLLVSYSASWLLSGGRYMLSNFPIFIILASLTEKREADFSVSLLLALLMMFFTLNYLFGHAIM